ncbi:transcription factor TFIIIB component B'' homolog [Anolis carolinensis]|uniref:transcription factor TFIIIB component B'' homolog n=1 Tax=Anolis carolinensis TaxID=28377 RepID=UPI002F2B5193
MFRRARFSVKPNVRPSTAAASGRGGGGPVPTLAVGPEPGGEQGPAAASGDTSGGAQQGGSKGGSRDEKTSKDGDCSKRAEALLQRRKRLSTVPNLAKPRVTSAATQGAVNPVSKHSTKQLPHSSILGSSVIHKETSSEKVNVEISPKSPALPEKKTPVPQVPQFSPLKKSASKEPNTCVTVQRSDEALQKNTLSPLKERPTQEKLIQDETAHSKSNPEKDKNRCSEREKIIKSQTLRKMLKEELKKEKEQRKYKSTVIEKNAPEDRSKMIMRDFIYYLPENNPMKSSLVQERRSEKTSTVTQAKEPEEKIVADNEDEDEEDEDTGAGEEDGPLLVPRVKVAEDGSIILDEESLTVEVLRTKGQCVVEENDPIFERGSTTTYSSFRKSYYTKPWSEKETDMFFLAISMVGTDFSLISQLFPHRARTEIKNKFKREEKANGWRIDKAFKEKKPFDFNWFAKLLEKVLENERKQKEKDAKSQQQNEKKSNEKKAQKRLKAKVVNGQPSYGPENFQISDTEMEVDAETAEKENEVLEQAEGQTVTESVVTKKKRKRKKKDSEHETDNPLEERTTSEEMAEGERLRKKSKNTSSIEVNSINEDDGELEVPDRVTPDETLSLVEDPQFCVVGEVAEQDCIYSIHDSTFIEAECSELEVLENSSEHHNGRPSVSPDTDKNGFKEISVAQSDAFELDILDGNQNAAAPSLDEELRKTKIATIKKPTVEGQRTASDFTGTSEKGGLSTSNTSEMKSRGSSVKSTVEDNVNDIILPISEETNNDMENKSHNHLEIQSGHTEKTEVRGRRQKPKPNILKASVRKEAPAQSNLDKPEMFGAVEKNNDQDDMPNTSIVIIAEKDPRHLDTESLACKKSTMQENSKQTALKPAPLARGRMQRPKPNLGCVVRRQGGSAKNIASEDGKTPAVSGEAESTPNQRDCSRALLNKNITEAIAYEACMSQSEEIQNKAVASAEIEGCISTSPGKRPLEAERHEFKNTSLSSKNLEIVIDAAVRDSSHQQDQKDFFAETEGSVKSYCHNLKQGLGKAAEKEEPSQAEKELLRNKCDSETTEESLEAAIGEIVPLSDLLEESSADGPEAVALKPHQLSPPNLSGSKGGEPNSELRSSDIQKSVSLGSSSKQNFQGERKESVVQPTPPLRSRFQKPKPNIGRAVARKETQSFVANEATVAHTETEKSEQQKFDPTRMSTVVAKPPQFSTTEALEKRSLGTEKMNQEDPQLSSTSHTILDPFLRKKPIIQEGKPCAIKPAQLVRGLFQKVKSSPGTIKEKKEGCVSENIGALTEGEDEVNTQTSLEKLKKGEKSESSEASLVESVIDQENLYTSENSQRCELLKDKEACVTKDDVEERLLDFTVRGISAPQEGSQSKTIKQTQLMRSSLQRPKPNISRSTKRKGVNLEDISEEDQTKRDTNTEATPFGNKPGEIATLMCVSGNLVEAATTSESMRQKDSTDSTETIYMKRSKYSGKCDSLEGTSGIGSQINEGTLKSLSVCEKAVEILKGKQPRRTVKQRKNTCDSRVPSECENDRSEKGKPHQKSKQNASRGRTPKPFLNKKTRKESGSSKPSLVTLRASSQEDEGDEEDDDDSEVEWFSPDEVNKAPVFVPKGLRSPNPVPVQIEETMEEIEIYENVADEPYLIHELSTAAHPVMEEDNNLCPSQVVIIQEEQNKETGIIDGSTEAAMTLLAMRDPAFQLNIATEEKPQDFPYYKEQNVVESLPEEHNEEHIIIHCNVPLCVPSTNELVSSKTVNRAAIEDPSTEPLDLEDSLQNQTNVLLPVSSKYEPVSSFRRRFSILSGLKNASQETTRASSVSSTSKENKISRPARCRFPKPKPNLNTSLGLNQNTSQKCLGLVSDMEQFNQIQNEVSKNTTEEQKVELEQNFILEEGAQISFAERHDLQPESLAVQRTNNKIKNLVKETWKVTSELTASKLSPEAEISHAKPPCDSNASINIQVSRSVEHHLSPAKVAQVGRSSYSGVSAITNMTAVSGSIGEHTPTEEEPTFILTLVEIPNDSEYFSGIPPSLPQASDELLPAPVFFTPCGTDSEDPEKEDILGTITSAVEENAVITDNSTEKPRLQTTSSEQLADLDSSSWKNQKRCALALEGSDSRSGKKRPPSSSVEDLEMSNKGASLRLNCISKKAAEKNSEKFNLSKKTISSTSRLVPELQVHVDKKEQLQSPLAVWAALFDEAAGTDKQVSRTLQAGKGERKEKQRKSVDTCKSLQAEQGGSTAIPPKTPLNRSYQRSLGFLPLICKNNNADEEEISKGKKESFQKTQEVISESAVECPVSPKDRKEEIQENSCLPLTVPLSSKFEGRCCSTVQVLSELSDSKSSSQEQEKEEEPTRISEYFFNDIFMEVDDSE